MNDFALPTPKEIAIKANEAGYFHIPAAYYYRSDYRTELLKLQQYYFELPADTDKLGGRKFRSRASYTLKNGEITLDPPSDYKQEKEDNPEQKGYARYFEPTSHHVLSMILFNDVVMADLEIAHEMANVDFNKEVEIGVHAIRYAPIPEEPSFSSPRWLHKDTEETVFVHLVNLSGNAIGGENVISHEVKFNGKFNIIRLDDPMETLLVNRKYFHAVIPLTVGFGDIAYRDVLLVTFNNKK